MVPVPLQTKQTFPQQNTSNQNSNLQEDLRRVNTAPETILSAFEAGNKSANVNNTPSQDDKQRSLFS